MEINKLSICKVVYREITYRVDLIIPKLVGYKLIDEDSVCVRYDLSKN